LTVKVYVADADVQGVPSGLFVVTVIVIVFPASEIAGVYTKANGVVLVEAGITVPPPFSVIVTPVALPPKVLLLTVTDVVSHVLPAVLLSVTVGGLIHPHETEKIVPVAVHPYEFLAVIV
jgi:hypothetical protein